MSRRPARFTQADIARAIRAVVQTGAPMAVLVELDGTIRISPQENRPAPPLRGLENRKPIPL